MFVSKWFNGLRNSLIGFYFGFALVYLLFELFFVQSHFLIFKSILVLVLVVLYWITSEQRNPFFFLTVFLSLIAYVLFFSDNARLLFAGIAFFIIYRLVTILYFYKLINPIQIVPILIAINPFLFVFFYFFSISYEIPYEGFYVLLANNILVCLLAALSLSCYVISGKNKGWFLCFGLTSVGLYFVEFVQKYYFMEISLPLFRLFEIILNVVLYYAFYKFVMQMEQMDVVEKIQQ
jgi:hypothetical protein